MFPKPESWRTVKAREDRQQAQRRSVCVEQVWQRDRAACVLCGRSVRRCATVFSADIGEVDELVPRSLGGDPVDPQNCRLLCAQCHRPNGTHRKTVRPESRDV